MHDARAARRHGGWRDGPPDGAARPADGSDFPRPSVARVIGIASPLAGAYVAILGARTVLLMSADIGGALGASADAATWFVTAYAMAELLVIPVAVYLALAVSMRRLMVAAAGAFVVVSLLHVAAESLEELLLLRAASGLTGGLFAPLSFMMILRTFRDRGRHEGLAGLSFAVIAPIGAAGMLGGLVLDVGDWRLLFLVQALLGAVVLCMAWLGIPPGPVDRKLLGRLDWRGYLLFVACFPPLMLVLTQGERLFWLESVLIAAFALVGLAALAVFAVHETRSPRPLVDLRLLFRQPNFGGVMFLNVFFRFGILVTAFVGAQFLARVQGYTLVELAEILPWIVVPQLVTFPLVYAVAKRVDPRLPLTAGLVLFVVAAWINANLTAEWAADQYRLSLLILAIAEPLFMISMTYEGVYGVRPVDGASATTLFNLTRSLGEASGLAVLATLVTEREKFHSNVMTESLADLSGEALVRLEALRERFLSLHADADLALRQALELLAESVRREAFVAAYNDAFLVLAGVMTIAVVLSLLLPRVPDITSGEAPAEPTEAGT